MLVSNVDNKFRLKMWISNVDYKCGLQISKKVFDVESKY